ncbi:uncharacterized protein LOC141717146 isoform X2 [Apium graveolens]|uniref:uncharacterized protein LOC141717146 isoform X2 n=1 Tax=Apium graveolens TaxID=4045 RepID=UPI003D7A94A6
MERLQKDKAVTNSLTAIHASVVKQKRILVLKVCYVATALSALSIYLRHQDLLQVFVWPYHSPSLFSEAETKYLPYLLQDIC